MTSNLVPRLPPEQGGFASFNFHVEEGAVHQSLVSQFFSAPFSLFHEGITIASADAKYYKSRNIYKDGSRISFPRFLVIQALKIVDQHNAWVRKIDQN